MPELRKRSRWDYLKKREAEKLEDLEAEIKDDEYLFSTDELTEREKRELEYKRTLRDLAKDYKKAGAKEQEERKNRYYMPEEKRSKVGKTGTMFRDSHLLMCIGSVVHLCPPSLPALTRRCPRGSWSWRKLPWSWEESKAAGRRRG